MKKFSKEMQADQGIEQMFAAKVWAYTAVIAEHGIGLGIAVANERGYTPVPLAFCNAETWDEMADHAVELNRQRGIDDKMAVWIISSTMAAQNRGEASNDNPQPTTSISLEDAAKVIVHLEYMMSPVSLIDDAELKYHWAEEAERAMGDNDIPQWCTNLSAAIRKEVDRRLAELADPDYWKPGDGS